MENSRVQNISSIAIEKCVLISIGFVKVGPSKKYGNVAQNAFLFVYLTVEK
jgi:hypothetical protein